MHQNIIDYNQKHSTTDREICDLLAETICNIIPEAENKIWHAHPVCFLDGNPIVGYSKLKDNIRLLFWSGQTLEEVDLKSEGKFKAAEPRFTQAHQINLEDLKRWLRKLIDIQWDYKTL